MISFIHDSCRALFLDVSLITNFCHAHASSSPPPPPPSAAIALVVVVAEELQEQLLAQEEELRWGEEAPAA
jgi:hypothetical protein